MNNNLTSRLTSIRMNTFLKTPFLGYILQRTSMIEDKMIHTAATEGLNIYYNPVFLENLADNEIQFVLLHELLHIVLHHPSRSEKKNHDQFNIACDIVVNDILLQYEYDYGKLSPILGSQFNLNGVYATPELIYDKLDTKLTKLSVIEHHLWRVLTETEENHIKHVIKDAIKEFPEINKEDWIRKVVLQNYRPKVPWKSVLNRLLIENMFDYNFQKTDKRFEDILLPDYAPTTLTLKDVWFIIDVSGSMKNELYDVLNECVHVIKMYPNIEISLSFFSTIVTEPKKLRNINDFESITKHMKSTGGTSFSVIFEKLKIYYPIRKPKALVIMTDGLAEYPKSTESLGIPVFWVVTNFHQKPPFGHVIYI